MSQTISLIHAAFAKTFGAALGAVIVYGALFTLVAMLAAPEYLLLERRSLTPAARTELVRELDAVDRVVTSVYEYLIYFAIRGDDRPGRSSICSWMIPAATS